jgi:hypothetical protein
MTNAELEKLIAASEAALRQAYALGRRDALDHVARWAQTEETTSTQLALVAPSAVAPSAVAPSPGVPAPAPPAIEPPAAPSGGPSPGPRPKPETPSPRPRGFGALLLDYVYPSS